MKKLLYTISFSVVAFLSSTAASKSESPPIQCLKNALEYIANHGEPLSIAPSDLERLANRIGNAIGLPAQPIRFFECDTSLGVKVSAYSPLPDEAIPPGRYVMYDKSYVRNITAYDEDAIVVLLGHELGHFLLDHFNAFRDLSTKEKERQADHFAGCAAAIIHRRWEPVSDLLRRVRDQVSYGYHNYFDAIDEAKKGFQACSNTFAQRGNQVSTVALNFIVPTYTTGEKSRHRVTNNRVGVSTGSLVERKCRSWTYGTTPGRQIDPQTVRIENRFTQGSNSVQILERTKDRVRVEFCAKSQISGFRKRTGDSFGQVAYDEIEIGTIESGQNSGSASFTIDREGEFLLPKGAKDISGVIKTALGRNVRFNSSGVFDGYHIEIKDNLINVRKL